MALLKAPVRLLNGVDRRARENSTLEATYLYNVCHKINHIYCTDGRICTLFICVVPECHQSLAMLINGSCMLFGSQVF